jgi:hypothetical protein
MLTKEEAAALGHRLDPPEQAARYESHMRACEHCRIALEVYRYNRDVAELLGRDANQS